MRRALDRLRYAWRALRHGPPPPPEFTLIRRSKLLTLVEDVFQVTGLPRGWHLDAEELEISALANAMQLLETQRHRDWARLEEGAWPC